MQILKIQDSFELINSELFGDTKQKEKEKETDSERDIEAAEQAKRDIEALSSQTTFTRATDFPIKKPSQEILQSE